MPLPMMQHRKRDRAIRMRQTQGWSPQSMAALLAMPPSHGHGRRNTAAEKPTARMTCPPCTKSVVASPASGTPSLLQETLPLGVADKGHAGTRGIPQRSHNGPQIRWCAVQGAMRCPTAPQHLPHSLCILLCAEEHGRDGCVDIHFW